MRKKVFVLALTVLFSLVMVSAAFAQSYDARYFNYGNNGNSGWVSDGHHGHYWSVGTNDRYVLVKGSYGYKGYHDKNHNKSDRWYRNYDKDGKVHYGYDWDRDGEWYYYKDDNGKAHYVYIDPDKDGKWYRYYDKNGNIQYYYDAK